MEYSANGGPGYIVSVGLLKRISYGSMEECLHRGELVIYSSAVIFLKAIALSSK